VGQVRFAACGAAGLLALALAGSSASEFQNRTARENDLKAVFLFNFTQFVQWPADAFADVSDPFVIGILGDDPFGSTLKEVVAKETVGKHKIVVRHYQDVRDIANCQMLFISPSESLRLNHIFEHLRGRSILSVGETESFLAHGGMIRFLLVGNKLHLQINLETAKAAHLTISSQLLRQAEVLGPAPRKQ